MWHSSLRAIAHFGVTIEFRIDYIQTYYQTFEKKLYTKTKSFVVRSRSQDQDIGHQVSREKTRPW